MHVPRLTTAGSQQELAVWTGTVAKCSREPGAVLQSSPGYPGLPAALERG